MDLTNTSIQTSGPGALINELERGIAIIRDLDDADYSRCRNGESSIGAHIRHNLDFVNAFMNGAATGRINYNARVRDRRVENDRRYAIEQLSAAVRRLNGIKGSAMRSNILVRSEIDEGEWHVSSVGREIEFLNSHTVHHYALVARLIRDIGQLVNGTFGVAPSTLRFRSGLEGFASRN